MVDKSALPRVRQRKDTLRQSILDAARETARNAGWQAVTIRKVADSIGYTHPTLYEFFKDKNALLAQLHRDGFRLLHEALRAARAEATHSDTAPAALALAYCNFAWSHRELYEVMHSLGGAHLSEITMTPEAEAVIAEAREMIFAWAADAGVEVCNADDAVLILWSTLHGIASLALSKQMPGGKKHAAQLAVQAVEGLFAAWKARKCV
jgi:AcrR family transcriptional regulator